MAAADVTRSTVHVLEDQVLSATLPVKTYIQGVVTTANPADTTAQANASQLVTATGTLTGVAVGDIVDGWGVVSGLATNQFVVAVYVSGTDTITALIGNLVNTSVTTTAVVLNIIVADVT